MNLALKVIATVTAAVTIAVFAATPISYGGWFGGPGKNDMALVKTRYVATDQKRCGPGTFPFEIQNGSKFTIHEVWIEVNGEVAGHSTKYQLAGMGTPRGWIQYDKIQEPGDVTNVCFSLDLGKWPVGERLIITSDLVLVKFKTADGVETVER